MSIRTIHIIGHLIISLYTIDHSIMEEYYIRLMFTDDFGLIYHNLRIQYIKRNRLYILTLSV